MRWHEVTGETLAQARPAAAAGDLEVQVVRTVPERVYKATPRGDFGILESYVRAFKAAERFIYIENQFLWSPEIEAVLARKAHAPAAPRLPAAAAPSRQAEQRRRRHPRRPRPPARSGRRCRPGTRDCTLYARSGSLRRQHLHPRQDRDRRRQLAHPRLREPQRALALQRHRDEHRQPRSRARERDPAASLGRAPRASDRTDPG